LQRIQDITNDISTIAAQQISKSDPSLHPFAQSFDLLLHDFKAEYATYALDDVVVGAIGQVVSVFLCHAD
jgi:hypothetical protein